MCPKTLLRDEPPAALDLKLRQRMQEELRRIHIALFHFLLPVAVLPIYASLRNVSDTTIEAACDLGATSFQILTRMILPKIQAGLFSAFARCFLPVAGDFVTPMLLGGTSAWGSACRWSFSVTRRWRRPS